MVGDESQRIFSCDGFFQAHSTVTADGDKKFIYLGLPSKKSSSIRKPFFRDVQVNNF